MLFRSIDVTHLIRDVLDEELVVAVPIEVGGVRERRRPVHVRRARAWREVSALVVVHGIRVERDPEGTFLATGGTLLDISPWSPDVGTLRPLAYRYQLPC